MFNFGGSATTTIRRSKRDSVHSNTSGNAINNGSSYNNSTVIPKRQRGLSNTSNLDKKRHSQQPKSLSQKLSERIEMLQTHLDCIQVSTDISYPHY